MTCFNTFQWAFSGLWAKQASLFTEKVISGLMTTCNHINNPKVLWKGIFFILSTLSGVEEQFLVEIARPEERRVVVSKQRCMLNYLRRHS